MSRSVKNLLTAALLQQPSMPHHGHTVSYFGNDGEIVRDEQHCQPELLLQIAQQLQHLRLHRYVQRRGGLIRNEKLLAGSRVPWLLRCAAAGPPEN